VAEPGGSGRNVGTTNAKIGPVLTIPAPISTN